MTDTTPAAIEALPREIARDIISGLMHAASYRSDRLQQTAAIDAAIAFVSTVPALAAERDAALTELTALRKEVERLRGLISGIREKSSSYLTSAMCDAALEDLKGPHK